MADVSRRARDAAGAAAVRLRRAVEGSPIGGLLEDQQHNLNDLLEQVQNTELRAKLMALYEQQQHAFFELAHTVQTNVTAQQQHLADVLTAVEDTIKARRAKVEEADPVDDLSDDDSESDEGPREAPFADVPAAKDAPADVAPADEPADFAPPVDVTPPAEPADFAPPVDITPPAEPTGFPPAADFASPPADFAPPVVPTLPAKKTPAAKKALKKAAASAPENLSGEDAPTPATIAKKVAAKKAAKKSEGKNPTQP